MNRHEQLISRLDAFIRKYYANRLLQGSLLLLICGLFYLLTISLGEYFLYMPAWLRTLLVALFLLLAVFALIRLILLPVLKMFRIGKRISHEQAAEIVGRHFPEISDKLLNLLQLRKQQDDHVSLELVEASILQKSGQLSVIPFTKAVDLSGNRKYLRFLLPLLLAGAFILFAAPNVFRDASERLLQPTKTFQKPAPFRFELRSLPLRVAKNGDFLLQAGVSGDALPTTMSVELAGESLPMSSPEPHVFQYTFRNVSRPVSFRLEAAGFYSETYTLQVAPRPLLKSFRVQIDYPDYTGRKDEVRSSLGDMTLPAGTRVQWAMAADHTDIAFVRFPGGGSVALPRSAGLFGFQYRFLSDTSYTLVIRNRQSGFSDSFGYHVQVIPDRYPVIQLQEHRDSITGRQVLLNGMAADDYGISRVLFRYEISGGNGRLPVSGSVPLGFTPGSMTSFKHYFDVDGFNLQPGQKLSYFVEVWDNDGVQGSKSSRSELMSYTMYNARQIDSAVNAGAQQINTGMSSGAEQTEELQQDYRELQSRMLQGGNMSWEEQQHLQKLAQKQAELKNRVEQVKKRFEDQMQQSKQKQYSEDIREKQEVLKDQLDNLLDKELAGQMKKLEELMKRLNKDQAFKTMQQLEQENKLFRMDMQRVQELMKQLEMQMRLEDMAGKMEQLAEKQLELKDQTAKGEQDNPSLAKEQQDLRDELDKAMQEDMKELKELNENMKQPQDLSPSQEEGKHAQQQMQQSKQSLDQDQKSKSGQSQSKAAQHMQQMAEMMRKQAGGMDIQQIEMDIRAVRQILTNLMRLSFEQEQLMGDVRQTLPSSQSYLANQKEQNRLHLNSRMIRDSLFVLSKRLFRLSVTVNKETSELEKNMGSALTALENRRTGEAVTRQQYVMTHTNNLALMLNEMLSNLMQMQSQAQSQQSSSCSNPGGSKPKPGAGQQLGDIITRQRDLGNAMQQMQQARQRGKMPGEQGEGREGGGGKDGNNGGQNGSEGEYGNPEQLARMAQQQAAIRRQLQELNSLINSRSPGAGKELRKLQEEMDRNETGLVNRKLSNEMLLRQREILTRLLETERSLREQEQDNKRTSRTPPEISRQIPEELQQYLKNEQQLLELYRTVPPQLKPYYKDMVDQYYRLIGKP